MIKKLITPKGGVFYLDFEDTPEAKLRAAWGAPTAVVLTQLTQLVADAKAAQALVEKYNYTLQDADDPFLVSKPVSFETFWDEYGYKLDRLKAQKIWDKLSAKDQQEAIRYIPIYEAHIKDKGTAKKYAKTYLADKPWVK